MKWCGCSGTVWYPQAYIKHIDWLLWIEKSHVLRSAFFLAVFSVIFDIVVGSTRKWAWGMPVVIACLFIQSNYICAAFCLFSNVTVCCSLRMSAGRLSWWERVMTRVIHATKLLSLSGRTYSSYPFNESCLSEPFFFCAAKPRLKVDKGSGRMYLDNSSLLW